LLAEVRRHDPKAQKQEQLHEHHGVHRAWDLHVGVFGRGQRAKEVGQDGCKQKDEQRVANNRPRGTLVARFFNHVARCLQRDVCDAQGHERGELLHARELRDEPQHHARRKRVLDPPVINGALRVFAQQ